MIPVVLFSDGTTVDSITYLFMVHVECFLFDPTLHTPNCIQVTVPGPYSATPVYVLWHNNRNDIFKRGVEAGAGASANVTSSLYCSGYILNRQKHNAITPCLILPCVNIQTILLSCSLGQVRWHQQANGTVCTLANARISKNKYICSSNEYVRCMRVFFYIHSCFVRIIESVHSIGIIAQLLQNSKYHLVAM